MLKKEVVFLILSLVFLIGAGCENSQINQSGYEISFDNCDGLIAEEKEACTDTIYLNYVKEVGDYELCEKINNVVMREDCYSYD